MSSLLLNTEIDMYYSVPSDRFLPWGTLTREHLCCRIVNCQSSTWGDNSSRRETYDYNSHSYTLIKVDNLELIEV